MQKRVKDIPNQTDPAKTFTRRYLYDGQNILFEFDEESNLLARHTHAPDTMDAIFSTQVTSAGVAQKMAKAAGRYYYLKDHLGTVNAIQDSSGNILQKYDYRVFGKIISVKNESGADISNDPAIVPEFTFTGREWDADSGLFYYRARYYDPSIGRFLQTDPDPGKIVSPITVVNRYSYCGNIPTIYKDPSGAIFGIDDIAFLIIATVAGGLAKDYDRQGGNFFENFLTGALNGFIAGAALLVGYHSISGLTNSIVKVASSWEDISSFNGFLSAAKAGFSSGRVAGQIVGGVLTLPAVPGAFDQFIGFNKLLKVSDDYSNYYQGWSYSYYVGLGAYYLKWGFEFEQDGYLLNNFAETVSDWVR